MKAEYTEEDFKHAVRNPYFHDFNKEVMVAVHHDAYEVFKKIAEENETRVDLVMNRCLNTLADELREAE